MKKRWLAFLTVLFAVCLGAMFAACTPGESGGEKQVTEVAVQTLPDKTEYALNEPFSVSGKNGSRFPVIEGSVGAALLLQESEEAIRRLAADFFRDPDRRRPRDADYSGMLVFRDK